MMSYKFFDLRVNGFINDLFVCHSASRKIHLIIWDDYRLSDFSLLVAFFILQRDINPCLS
jgi:hypothetical protein